MRGGRRARGWVAHERLAARLAEQRQRRRLQVDVDPLEARRQAARVGVQPGVRRPRGDPDLGVQPAEEPAERVQCEPEPPISPGGSERSRSRMSPPANCSAMVKSLCAPAATLAGVACDGRHGERGARGTGRGGQQRERQDDRRADPGAHALQRDVAVLALRPRLALGEQRLQRRDQLRPRLVRHDHVVDVAALGRRVRVREARLVVGDQLLRGARPASATCAMSRR